MHKIRVSNVTQTWSDYPINTNGTAAVTYLEYQFHFPAYLCLGHDVVPFLGREAIGH